MTRRKRGGGKECLDSVANEPSLFFSRAVDKENSSPGSRKPSVRGIGKEEPAQSILSRAVKGRRDTRSLHLKKTRGTPLIFSASPGDHRALPSSSREGVHEMKTGADPIQILRRLPVTAWRYVPGKVQKMGGLNMRHDGTYGLGI
jgi:hypothetical protein